jgi:hypothetical protein
MTTTAPVPTTMSTSDKIATYFVVPVIPDDGSTESILYFEEVAGTEKWGRVSSKNLNARGQGRNAGKIVLLQPAPEIITGHTDLPTDKLDTTVTLYAGVAQTLIISDDLDSVYPLSPDGTLTIPVTAHTTRGLILVFSKASSLPPYAIMQLIGSTDPEIKNSTGGLGGGGH